MLYSNSQDQQPVAAVEPNPKSRIRGLTVPLVCTSKSIAEAFQVCESTYRCFASVSRPLALPFERLPSSGKVRKSLRGYHVGPVIEWIKRAAPERATPEFERKLYALAVPHNA